MSPEFALHGTPASFRSDMACILITPAFDDRQRSATLARVARQLGMSPVLHCSESDQADLRFHAPHPLLRPFTAILPFHRLTVELARVRDTDPDTLHGNQEPWKTIMTGLQL